VRAEIRKGGHDVGLVVDEIPAAALVAGAQQTVGAFDVRLMEFEILLTAQAARHAFGRNPLDRDGNQILGAPRRPHANFRGSATALLLSMAQNAIISRHWPSPSGFVGKGIENGSMGAVVAARVEEMTVATSRAPLPLCAY
jgi:hypothetical protein